jgi:hypothetical protein
MIARLRLTIALAVVLGLGGCASSHVLLHTTTTTTAASSPAPPATTSTATGTPTATTTTTVSPAAAHYVAQLRAEEQNLAAAERRIPTNASTPQALARSTTLLGTAVSRLANGLAAISPPDAVVSEHARLVAIVRGYAGRLRAAAALARRPRGQVQASRMLVSATNRASAAFVATLSKIYSTLGVRQP